jgi:hypothetical protein
MWFILYLLTLCEIARGFSILNLSNLEFVLKPNAKKCDNSVELIVIVHSAPNHYDLRNTIRETWGSAQPTLFILGENSDENLNLKVEHEKFGDLVQANFQDSYRNMTYKHLLGYW